jgi:two-component system cell cycle sensor histidine kinase/response regulator CckA
MPPAAQPLATGRLDEQLESRLLHAQRLEVLGRIAGGIAHDFNNLLTVIKSYSQFVEAELPPGSAARVDINEVVQAANSAAHLTRQLLSFGCKRAVEPQLLDVNTTVGRILSMLRRVIGEDIHIETDLSSTACAVLADPVQLEQVLMNLAVNARDAMPDGGLLRFRTSAVAIDSAPATDGVTLPPGKYVSIVVEDTGVGIDEDAVEKIFEAFFTTKGEGAGLGLAMVMSIVEKLGGKVRVESTLGEGSRFTVLLPCLHTASRRVSVEDGAKTTPTLPPPKGVESILVLEDELGVRAAVRRMLERLGYTVSEAATGSEAMDVVAGLSGLPDLVLMDVIMPGQSGPVVAARLLHRWPTLRVMFMSGYSADELLQRGITIPAGALLEKPVTIELLAHAVRQALDAVRLA